MLSKSLHVQLRSNLPPSKYTKRHPIKGLLLPRCRSVCLTIVLCLGVCGAQEQSIATGQNPVSDSQTAQPPIPASQAPTAQPDSPAPTPSVASLAASASLNSLQGLKVASIQINSPGIDDPGRLLLVLPQKVNEPLDKYKVRQSVQALYNTGRFAEIQVEAQRNPSGEIALIFDARENYFFGSILAEGSPAHPTDSQLVNASKLNLGEQYTEEKIAAGIDGMQRALQENGYYQATIKPFYEWDSRNQQVKVRFLVTPGKPARIGAINVGGSPGYSA